MPYSSDIQIVNDANGGAHAFLADDGLLFACQWNAQAQRWDKGQVVPGSEGARGLQALVVDDLWPSSGSSGTVPGNAQGIVLAYRIGEGSSSQVVASFGAWGSDGSLGWTQAQPLSSQQGSDEAFALVPAADGSFKLVLQKREVSATPQELLAQFSENPSELLAKQLDELASGARKDSDLYVSNVQINSSGNGGYALQLSAPGLSPNSQTTALTPATPTPTPATPAPAFGDNTQLSRAVLAANGVPSSGGSLQSAAPLRTAALLSGDEAPTATESVAFTQIAASSAGGSGFSFTNYIKNPASLASLVLYPVRYSLGTALGRKIAEGFRQIQQGDDFVPNNEYTLTEKSSSEDDPDSGSFVGLPRGERSRAFSETRRVSRLTMDPQRSAERRLSVVELGGEFEEIEVVASAAPVGGTAQASRRTVGDNLAFNLIYANPAESDFTLSGAYGGLLAGRGGYTVVNFSTFRYGRPAQDSASAAQANLYRPLNIKLNNASPTSSQVLGEGYSPGWKLGQGMAGSFKTLFQYSNPGSPGGATTLIGFNAQQSLGWNGLAHNARYYASGARFSLDLSLIAGFVMEQRYASTDGLFKPLADIGLGVGALGDALSLVQTGGGIYGLASPRRRYSNDLLQTQTNGLGINTGYKEPLQWARRFASVGGLASLGLAAGIPLGVGLSRMNANGTYSYGLGFQENLRGRLLSKYGVGLEVIAGAQENVLWTLGGGPIPSLQALAFASVGAALPFGGFVPVIPNMAWNYEGNQANTGAADPSAADLGAAAGLAASSTPAVSRGSYIVAPKGAAYPMGYAPASATDALLALPNGPIASLLDAPTQVQWHLLQSFTADDLAPGLLEWSKNNLFVGLNDGTYSNVPLVGLSLPGSAPATASFTASGGVISNLVVQGARSLSLPGFISIDPTTQEGVLTLQADSDPALQSADAVTGAAITGLDLAGPLLITGLAAAYDADTQQVSYRLNQAVNLGSSNALQTIGIATAQGQYLALPEPRSGRYVFGLDVFQTQNGNPAPPTVPTAGSVLDAMPLFSLQMALGSNGSPLSTADIQRIPPQLPISGLSQSGGYPKADGSLPAANDTSVYTYSNVPIALLNSDGSGASITPLNPGVTATVKLSAGEILAITLDQPLYFNLPSAAYAGLPYTLVVDIEQALGNADLVNPELLVTPQQNGLNNFTDQDSFSANASINNAGVFLSSGVSDQLPLLSSFGAFAVQNRVAYQDGDTVVYLNNTGGSSSSWEAVSASQLELEAIYNEPENYQFTAASNPTAITDTASSTTYVFWVEASVPVIPLTGSDGEANYQAFMDALYDNQRINYSYATTSQAGTNTKWNYVNANDLYVPDDTLITDLRSFQVELDGVQRSLLVWTELPISALKTAELNPKELITTQLAVIKAGLINPNAASTPGGYTWAELFNDAYGNSTIATIPWSEDRGSGLSIADLSAATLQVQMDAVARFSGTINGTTLLVNQLSSGSLAVGDLILGSGVRSGTTVTAITKAATASSAGSYQVSTSQTVSSTNFAAVPLSGDAASAAISFSGSFSGSGNTILTLAAGAGALQVGDQLFGVGIEPGTFITAVLSPNSGTGAGSFQLNRGPASASGSAALLALPAGTPSPDTSQTLTTPVLSWSEAVRTPYNEAVLASAPLLYVPMAGLQAGINSLNLGSAFANNETFASSTGLNTAIAGALPKSNATAVENVEGLGVLATGLGTANSATLEVMRNTPQTPLDPAASPVAIFTGAINGTTLSITTTVSQGTLAVGELVVGEGIPSGTTIAALPSSPNSAQTGDYTLAYLDPKDRNTTLAATTLRTLPESGGLPLASFSGSFSGSGGANGFTTLAITNLSGTLQVGDQVLGLGLAGGSTVLEVASLDLNAGTAQVLLSQGPPTSGGNYGLAASPGGSTSPYTIEFWTQLDPDSNPAGAGLVALGQPSDTALSDRPVELPTGWLLSSSFGVERLTWQDALNLSLETSLDGNEATDLYGWRWALVADGTNTTAMDGTGGDNLYRNALLLNNLLVGDTIEGVESFLAAYGLSSTDLIGLDGTPANQIAASPSTQFQFTSDFRPNAALDGASVPTTSLNGVAIDTSTALMNGGLVLAEEANANANLTDMFNVLWDFEQTYGQAKVNFSLNPLTQPALPAPSDPPTPPSANTIEQYGGYQLQFVLQPGPAVSVNGSGQLVFDVAPGVTLVSADGVDYRNSNWNYVAASYLPEFNTYSASGTVVEVPRNVGTANLYVNGKLVATQANVINAYTASNFNDAAVLLSDNAGGAIDLLAIYGQALTTSQAPAFASDWPLPTSTDALDLLKEVGFVVSSKTPNPGQQPGAISNHYLAHTVDPNNAAKSTFTSVLRPNADGGLSWSEASTLSPIGAVQPTTPSASTTSLGTDLLIPIAATAWGQQGWYTNLAPSTAVVANPAGQTLKGITVTLTPTGGGTAVIRQLSTEEVLVGTSTLAALQPRAQDANFAYTFLSNAPALNLRISREPSGTGDSNKLDAKLTYTASVQLQFADGTSLSNALSGQPAGTVVPLGFSTSLAATLKTEATTPSSALATADVLEQAPLQLEYVDSGVVLSSQASPSDSTPASSFGTSQVYGSFTNPGTNSGTNSGWLAISQPRSANAASDPAGRVWINFAGEFSVVTNSFGKQVSQEVSDPAQAPTTWLNALAASDFSPNRPNLPLLNSALYQSSTGGLLIKADASAGWGQNFGSTMLVADVNNDGTDDLVIAAPQANGGGAVVVISGLWIADNLTSSTGQTILDLSNPGNLGSYVTVLRPGVVTADTDITTAAGFGSAIAFQPNSNALSPGTLWIGAPNYLRTLDSSNAQESTQPIGALYSYSTSSNPSSWGSANPTLLSNPLLGSSGTLTTPQAGNTTSTSWWGAQLGTAVAISSAGDLAVSAPGVVGAMVYTGTEATSDQYNNFNFNAQPELTIGLLNGIQIGGSIDSSQAYNSSAYKALSGLQLDQLTAKQTTFLTNFKSQLEQITQVAGATMQNNQAIQAAAIGSVMVFNSGSNLASLGGTAVTASGVQGLNGRTYLGANPFNTLGDSGFGSSLSFADLTNTNVDQLIVGASQSGGGGLVYMFDPSASYSDTSLGQSQYLAALAATNIITAAEANDYLGSGLVNLGDVNSDDIDDLLIQAYNAASSAGKGYVLFSSDQLSTSNANQGLISLATGSIGTIQTADSTNSLAILSELGSAGGITGQGTYGPGDYNANGLNDIALGSGPNGKGYLTWGQPYLASISDLQLSRLTSNNGFLLDGLATTNQGSLRAIGDFNGDGYGDFLSIQPGPFLTNVRIELGGNTQEILADAPYSYYTFTVANGTQVLPAGDMNGDGMADIALFLDQNLSSSAEGNQGAGSTTGILYGRTSGDLPLGSGFGYIAPVDPNTNAPLSSLPGLLVEGPDGEEGLTDATPAVIAVGNTLYAAVKGYGDNTLWFSRSLDGGSSWDSWSELTSVNSAFSTSNGPSLLSFDGKIYLSYVNSESGLSLSSWDPGSTDLSAWTAPIALSDATAGTAGFSSDTAPQLVERGDSIGVLWVQDGSVLASTNTDPSNSGSNWSAPEQLQQLVNGSGAGISASSAPSFTWLGTSAVLAVNEAGLIKVYGALGGSSSLQLASTFNPPSGERAITSAPVLTTSDTGVVLTYTNPDGSISVNRLDLLSPAGSPLPGVTFTADGGVDVSEAAINWQSTLLTDANSGISSSLASTPVVVEGNLLLANVRNSSTPDNQIWLNAIPNASDPASTTWLNSTVQLPNGSGGSILSQRAGADNLIGGLTPGAWQDVANGAALSAPSLTHNGDTVYMAVQGTNNNLYWNSSSDNGQTWNSWQGLPTSMGTYTAPSIAYFNNTLYLCYVAAGSNDLNITYLKSGNSWETQYQISGQTATAASMITEGGNLAVYFVSEDASDRILKSYTSTSTPGSTSWTNTSVEYLIGPSQSASQTASSNLALTRYNGQTYIAFQGGTSSSPSSTIYLTTASDSVANGTSPVWTLLDTPAGIDPVLRRGVGLTSGSQGLVLTYTDTNQPNQVAVQLSNADVTDWAVLDDSIGLSSSMGYTPLITAGTQNSLLIAGNTSNDAINIQLNQLNAQILNSAQTGSTLSAIGDINSDGFDDLAITANNVAYSPSGNFGSSDAQLTTGVRVVLGAATATALSGANDSNSIQQTVQIAGLYPQPSSSQAASTVTPVANLSGPTTLVLNGALSGSSYQISSTAGSASGSPLNIADVTAAASNPASLQQLFAGASATTTPIPASSTAQGTGSQSLQTLGGFGDLNGDGYVDYLAPDGIKNVYSSDGAIVYDVWSIRAAGDVNGNSVDDVLLTLSPAETSGQWLQTALVDGSLFHVENNQFSLAKAEGSAQTGWSTPGLKAPLNPYQYAYSENTPPGLQQWVQPILNYQPGNQLTSLTTGTQTTINSLNGADIQVLASAVDSDGTVYIVTEVSGNVWQLFYGRPNEPSGTWTVVAPPQGGGFPTSVAIYDGSIYIFEEGYNSGALSIQSASLNSDLSVASSWSAYTLSTITGSILSGTGRIVNEGDRLALYYVNTSGSSKNLVSAVFATTTPTSSLGLKVPVTSSSWGGTLGATGFSGAPVLINVAANGNGSESGMNAGTALTATRFQGKTILAYYSSPYSSSSDTLYVAESNSREPGSSFTSYATSLGIWNNQLGFLPEIQLAASASQLYLYQVGTSGSIATAGAFDDWSNAVGWSNTTPATFYVSQSQLYLAANTPPPKNQYVTTSLYTSPVTIAQSAPQQLSLAGYSIDGNIDINGDGLMDMLISDPSDPAKSVDNQYALFGGDYLKIATQVGTDGNDVMEGTPLADVIYSLEGSDQVDSNGGADVIYTGAGDDAISIIDNAFFRIDAGSGFDVLALEGNAGQSYDFRLDVATPEYFAGTKLRDTELISSQDYGANTLRFDVAAVNAINPDRILFLTPDALDTIVLTTEFQRNSAFDTTYGGSLWNAYTAGSATTPTDSNPTLVYVLNPVGASDSDWLNAHVLCIDSPTSVVSATLSAFSGADDSSGTVVGAPQATPFKTTTFGKGLAVQAFTSNSGDPFVRYLLTREDSSQTQVATYSTTPRNSWALAGVDFTPVFGQIVLEVGEFSREIWIPTKDALKLKKGSSITLEFEEHSHSSQKEFHLLIEANPDTPGGSTPVMSGFHVSVDEATDKALVSFRADAISIDQDLLTFTVSKRSSADTLALDASQDVAINDFTLTQAPGASNGSILDRDGIKNQQVSTMLEVNLNSKPGQSLVALAGPDANWQSSVQLLNANTVRFQQDAPLTSWRADTGPGLVTFGLQSGSNKLTLITDASGGSSGSIDPTIANSATDAWQSSEGRAIGSRAITDSQNLSGLDWTPTATQDGQPLALLNLAVDGNQVTATFAGGVTGVFWQASGSAPSLLPVPVAVEVQRLAGYANSLGFYTLDPVTGNVGDFKSGDSGYLQAALARSQDEGLFLDAASLPAFGASTTYNYLPFDTRKSYGVLLVQNGDTRTIFSSFAAANPGGATQMVSLGNSPNSPVLGIEDISVSGGFSDSDYNDVIVRLKNVSLALF